MLLEVFSWVGFVVMGVFVTLCLAAGLFYLAELVEEYTVLTKRILHYCCIAVVTTQLVLGIFTSVSMWPVTCVGVAAHVAYYSLLHDFPFFNFTSAEFILSCVLVVAHHFVVFSHFSSLWYPFDQVVAYFVICVWTVPFTLFISLSANENVLPTMASGSETASDRDNGVKGPRRGNSLLGFLTLLKSKTDSLLPRATDRKTF